MPTTRAPNLNKDEFKAKFIENLKQSGFLHKMKSELRSRLVQELQMRTNLGVARRALADKQGRGHTKVEERAIESLILSYLKWRGHSFTLSVYLPEIGLTDDQILDDGDIVKLLHLQDRMDETHEFPLILRIWEFLQSRYGNLIETGTQADEGGDPLYAKLAAVDSNFNQQLETERLSTQASIHERMVQYQRECDKRLEQEVQIQLQKYKDVELNKALEKEQHKFEQKLAKMRDQIETDVREREKTVEQQEKELEERAHRREKEFEADTFKERQRLLNEFEALKQKEANLKREIELVKRSAEVEEEKARQKHQSAMEKLAQADKIKSEYEQRLKEENYKYQLQFDREHSSMVEHVREERVKLEMERVILKERMEKYEYLKDQLKQSQQELALSKEANAKSQSEVMALKHEVEVLRTTYNDIKASHNALQLQATASHSTLEVEMNAIKKKLADAEKHLEERTQQKQELSDRAKKLGDDVHKYKKIALKWQKEGQQLEIRQDGLINLNEELTRRLDDEVIRNKELMKEISDLRMLLHHSQAALANGLTVAEQGKENLSRSQPVATHHPFREPERAIKMETRLEDPLSQQAVAFAHLIEPLSRLATSEKVLNRGDTVETVITPEESQPVSVE